MTDTSAPAVAQAPFGGVLSIIWSPRAYLDFAFVMVEFALGTFYFVFLVTILSVGVSLVWTFVGLPILVFALIASRSLATMDCGITESLTGTQTPRLLVLVRLESGLMRRLIAVLADGDSWRSVLFLLFRFPLGVFGFCVVISLVSSSLWMIWQPVIVAAGVHTNWGIWQIDAVWKGFLFVIPGLLLLPLALWATVGVALLLAGSSRWMIGRVGQDAMRQMVLRSLSGGRSLEGPSLLREMQIFHGYSVDLTATKVYGTLLGLESAGLVQRTAAAADAAAAAGLELYSLTARGEEAAAVPIA
jgi:Putative sensor